MSAPSEKGREKGAGSEDTPPRYEAPAIIWAEPYEPIGFGLSCARLQGNPGCFPGPTFQ